MNTYGIYYGGKLIESVAGHYLEYKGNAIIISRNTKCGYKEIVAVVPAVSGYFVKLSR